MNDPGQFFEGRPEKAKHHPGTGDNNSHAPASAADTLPPCRVVDVLGVQITDTTMDVALSTLESLIRDYDGSARSVYFVNAHTLNQSRSRKGYRDVLNSADLVYGDGTGVRWAARAQGIRLYDNVNGTDLTPALFQRRSERARSYFLLGATPESIERAAHKAKELFPAWTQVGYHHGYLKDDVLTAETIDTINDAAPDVLLVGMGNPLQEEWINEHLHELKVPVCMAIGGLFDYWADNINRAPVWMRKLGMEWLGLLLQQPKKAGRYLLGNPLFLARVGVDTIKKKLSRGDGKPCPDEIAWRRWVAKKSARRALATGAWGTGFTRRRSNAADEPRVRVLTYHRFGEGGRDPFRVSRSDFEAQMAYLAKHQLAISLDQFMAFLAGEATVPDGSVLITSDDGFRSVYEIMLPALKSHNLPGVAFVSPGFIDESPEGATEPYMTWGELRELTENNIAVQSHGWKHRSLGLLDEADVRTEAARSRKSLEAELGHAVTSIAYPYGTRADFNETSERILAEEGYRAAFTSQHGAVERDTPAIRVPRIKVEGGDSLWMFQQTCRGAMDGWRVVDQLLYKLQTANR